MTDPSMRAPVRGYSEAMMMANTGLESVPDLPRPGCQGHRVKAEFNTKPHKRGVLSMARSNDPDSAGSQFFICVADSNFLDWQYTAFGEVVSGIDVADTIVNAKRDGRDNPLERVEMTITVTE